MAKKDIKAPKFSLYSPDDFSYYGSVEYSNFYEQLQKYKIPFRTKNMHKVNVVTAVFSVGLTSLFLLLGGPWFLFWVPICISLAVGMILDRIFMISIPKSQLKKKIAEEEIRNQQRKLEAMAPPAFDTVYLKKQIKRWENIETPDFIKDAYIGVMYDLKELITAIEENDLDLDRWISLFKRYIPDIVDVVKEYESYDDVNDQALIDLFTEMSGYVKSEINYAKMGKRVSHSSTIKAYTTFFSGQNGDKPLGGV